MSPRRRPTNFVMEGTDRHPSWEAIRRHVLLNNRSCALCGAPSAEVDHIWPRFYGGDDRAENLQALCVSCNRSKGNTVDPTHAEPWQLYQAIEASVMRAVVAAEDLERFIVPLIAHAVAHRTAEGARLARAATSQVDIAAESANRARDLLTEWMHEINDPSTPDEAARLAFDHIFGQWADLFTDERGASA